MAEDSNTPLSLEVLLAGRVPAEPLPRTREGVPEVGYWALLPPTSRWTLLIERENGTSQYAYGCFGDCWGTQYVYNAKLARKYLDREKEQAAMKFVRSRMASKP